MSDDVIKYYENYREEERITTNNARKIEFLTTTCKLDKLLNGSLSILDCAAGTGTYAFYFANKGHMLTATDITPRHIKIIEERLKTKTYAMDVRVLNATNMSCFRDETFDVVLNMGPFYHLTQKEERDNCLRESLRVLKRNGYLVIAYIPRLYINQMLVMSDVKYLNEKLLYQIRDTGVLIHNDPNCFWTDSYYSSFDEMQKMYSDNEIEIIDHFAQDGLAPLFHTKIDQWSEEQFTEWFKYHLSVCSEKTIIDMSNHAVIVGRKK